MLMITSGWNKPCSRCTVYTCVNGEVCMYLELTEGWLQSSLDGCIEWCAVGVERGCVLGCGPFYSDQSLTNTCESIWETLSEPLGMAGCVGLGNLLGEYLALTGVRERDSRQRGKWMAVSQSLSSCTHCSSPAAGSSLFMACSLPLNLSTAFTSWPLSKCTDYRTTSTHLINSSVILFATCCT